MIVYKCEYKFSVLMSLYLKEQPEYLSQCLESLSKQVLMASEIVCVYDGPIPEKLQNVISYWKDKLNIVVVTSKKNIGLGRALNLGLKHCSHNIVARMDTDDIAMADRFSCQIPIMFENEKLAVLGSNIIEFEGVEQNPCGYRNVPENSVNIIKYSRYKNPFNHMTVVFKKNIINEVGGYTDHPLMEDYNLWLRVISCGYDVMNIQKPLVKARVGRDMLKRRSGIFYVRSEYQLALLKCNLKIQNPISAFSVFVMRSIPRVLPVKFLSAIYKINRNEIR